MSAEWATFWAIVVTGIVALDRLRAIAERLNAILGDIRGARHRLEEDSGRDRMT
jgi:hypothetical protein